MAVPAPLDLETEVAEAQIQAIALVSAGAVVEAVQLPASVQTAAKVVDWSLLVEPGPGKFLPLKQEHPETPVEGAVVEE